jgi:uncharacterized membrane protein
MNDITDNDNVKDMAENDDVNDLTDTDNVNDITDNDKLMAALCYPIGVIMSVVILVSESMKDRPFQKFHAVQALVYWAVAIVISVVLSFVVVGCFIGPLAWLFSLWMAYKAYQGEYYELPVIADFIRKQGWVE